MDGKNFDFANTTQALAELSSCLAKLNANIENKKNELQEQRKQNLSLITEREEQLEILKNSSRDVIQNIDNIINRLDNVLQENGSSNNNN